LLSSSRPAPHAAAHEHSHVDPGEFISLQQSGKGNASAESHGHGKGHAVSPVSELIAPSTGVNKKQKHTSETTVHPKHHTPVAATTVESAANEVSLTLSASPHGKPKAHPHGGPPGHAAYDFVSISQISARSETLDKPGKGLALGHHKAQPKSIGSSGLNTEFPALQQAFRSEQDEDLPSAVSRPLPTLDHRLEETDRATHVDPRAAVGAANPRETTSGSFESLSDSRPTSSTPSNSEAAAVRVAHLPRGIRLLISHLARSVQPPGPIARSMTRWSPIMVPLASQ
jgi:hypothetical protein